MTDFVSEVLAVDGSGHMTTAIITVTDSDSNVSSLDTFATWSIDGVALAASPAVDLATIQLIDGLGHPVGLNAMHFSSGGKDYFMMTDSWSPDAFTSFTSFTPGSTVGGISYIGHGFGIAGGQVYQGEVLLQQFDANTQQLIEFGIDNLTVHDDDGRIQFDGTGGAPNSEAGDAPLGLFGLAPFTHLMNTRQTGDEPQFLRVDVDAETTSGAVSFEAMIYRFNDFVRDYVYFLPATGSVDLHSVTSITGFTALGASMNGERWEDFGLNDAFHLMQGSGNAEIFLGDTTADDIRAGGGDDTLCGGLNDDSLLGATGNDQLFGGMQADTLDGAGGDDLIHGGLGGDEATGGDGTDTLDGDDGNDSLSGGKSADLMRGDDGQDTLLGGDGNDTLQAGAGDDSLGGGTGADLLRGGEGKDTLQGGDGADTLNGDAGQDTLKGGSGGDTFVFGDDGSRDVIQDFEDGLDKIDLPVSFASLTITSAAAGTVTITYGSDTLILHDTAGVLTAANLTAADFL